MRAAAGIPCVAFGVGEPADDRELIAIRRQRFEQARHLEIAPVGRREELAEDDPVGHVEEPEPRHGTGGRPAERRQRRKHGVEQGERKRRADAAKERPSMERRFRHKHDSCPRTDLSRGLSMTRRQSVMRPKWESCGRCWTAWAVRAADRRISTGPSGRKATRPRRAKRAEKTLGKSGKGSGGISKAEPLTDLMLDADLLIWNGTLR